MQPNANAPVSIEPSLHRAARLGDHDQIRQLVRAGADVNEPAPIIVERRTDPLLMTPLMLAASSADGASVETLTLLLELGADPTICLSDSSAARYAFHGILPLARGGDLERARLLSSVGSPLQLPHSTLSDLLCLTCRYGDAPRIEFLLSIGAKAVGDWTPEAGLARAHRMQRDRTEATLAKAKAVQSISDEDRARWMNNIIRRNDAEVAHCAAAPFSFEIPLFCAAGSGKADNVLAILQANETPLRRDFLGQTAMYEVSSVEVARILMQAGLSVEDADHCDNTPLTHASSYWWESAARIQALIEVGAKLEPVSPTRRESVFVAACSALAPVPILKLLLDAGADPNFVDDSGQNALHRYAYLGRSGPLAERVQTIQFLLSLGVQIEHRDKHGRTPLARDVAESSAEFVEAKCLCGADPNSISPLHVYRRPDAGSSMRLELPLLFHVAFGVVAQAAKARSLLRAGADPLATDSDGRRPLHLVIEHFCRKATDPRAASLLLTSRIEGLSVSATSSDRDGFIGEATDAIRACITEFATTTPLTRGRTRGEFYEESVETIALLRAFELWHLRERTSAAD